MDKKGEARPGQKTLPVTVDEHGNIRFDAIVKLNENASKTVYSQHRDLVTKILRNDDGEEKEEDVDIDDAEKQKEIEEITMETKGYTIPLDKRLAADGRGLQDVQINDNFAKLSEALYVAEQKAREAVGMRSKVQKEMLMKVPLDKRLAADGRGLQDVQINDNFAKLSEALYVAEQKAREAVGLRSKVQKEMLMKVPLDKSLAADGRGLLDVQINDNFAKLSEALYVAEQKAREVVGLRSKVQKEMLMKVPLDKRLAADGRGLQDVQINDNSAKLSEALYVVEQRAREAVGLRSKVQKAMRLEKERKEGELRPH